MHKRKIRKFLLSNKGCSSTSYFNLILPNDAFKAFSFENGGTDKLFPPFLWEADSELEVFVLRKALGLRPMQNGGEGSSLVHRYKLGKKPKGDSLNPIHRRSASGMTLQSYTSLGGRSILLDMGSSSKEPYLL